MKREEVQSVWSYNIGVSEMNTRVFSPTISILLTMAAVFASGNVAAQSATRQLVGFTNATATGDAGLLVMDRSCYLEFPHSRMCTTDEIVATIDPPLTAGREYAWAHSVLVASLASRSSVFDSVGIEYELGSNHRPNCAGWAYTGTFGPVIATDSGSASIRPCSDPRRVACCGFKESPIIFADGFDDGTTDAWSSTKGDVK